MPPPNQAALRLCRQFELLAYPPAFHPENPAGLSDRDDQFTAARPGNFLIHEPILKFQRRPHPDGLKSVARTPMTQCDLFANPVRVEKFAPGARAQTRVILRALKIPVEMNAGKVRLPRPLRQMDRKLMRLEFECRLRLQLQQAGRVAGDKQGRTNVHPAAGRLAETFNQFKFRRHPEAGQLQLQNPALDGDRQVGEGRDAAPRRPRTARAGRPCQFLSAIVAPPRRRNRIPRR